MYPLIVIYCPLKKLLDNRYFVCMLFKIYHTFEYLLLFNLLRILDACFTRGIVCILKMQLKCTPHLSLRL